MRAGVNRRIVFLRLWPFERGSVYLWAYRTGPWHPTQAVVFDFAMSRAQATPARFLQDYQGVLQVDGYAGYNEVLRRDGVVEAGCMAHARRKFVEVWETTRSPAEQTAITELARLYAIESDLKDMSVADRQRQRKARAGIYAAIMAEAGLDGPSMPFEGKHGWFDQITGQPLIITEIGGDGIQFKVETTLIKPRTTCAATISTALAAEKAAGALKNRAGAINHVSVEVYESAKEGMGTGAHHWNPQSRETADHSIPYVVTVALLDGSVTPAQFDEAHLRNPAVRGLLSKVSVKANPEFTAKFKKHPAEHHARVTVTMMDGQEIIGESGGDKGDLSSSAPRSEIETKFRGLTERFFGTRRVDQILEVLWNLDSIENVAIIPPMFALKP